MSVEQYPLLDRINSVADLKQLAPQQLPQLCTELRQFLISSISRSSGHFASNLGSVELTVALHYVFSSPQDKILWDVGHQAYGHKVLTGRKSRMHTIRKTKGLHPFPFRKESEHDILTVGHSSTSLSAGAGISLANLLQGKKENVIPVIGDGALTAGMVFEALNHAGHDKLPMTIILNDNNMSISANRGALNQHSNQLFNSHLYKNFRETSKKILPGPLKDFLKSTESALKSFLSPKVSNLFTSLGCEYVGPVDGHNVEALVELFQKVKNNGKLQLIHVLTVKGKGYQPAEEDPIKFHGVGKFEPDPTYKLEKPLVAKEEDSTTSKSDSDQVDNAGDTASALHRDHSQHTSGSSNLTGSSDSTTNSLHIIDSNSVASKVTLEKAALEKAEPAIAIATVTATASVESNASSSFTLSAEQLAKSQALKASLFGNSPVNNIQGAKLTYSQVFGKWLVSNLDDQRLVAVTPAMCEGSGMQDFAAQAGSRFVDVAIAEQHAVTFAAGLAIGGLKPVVAIYSTFLQRAYDQVIHDVAIDNHDLLFAIDRAGLVGEDGQTHQGAFDGSYLRCIPNLELLAPSSLESTIDMLTWGYHYPGAVAVRYPRGQGITNRELAQYGKDDQEEEALLAALEQPLERGKAQLIRSGHSGLVILSFGTMLKRMLPLAVELDASLYDMRWLKPLDQELLLSFAKHKPKLIVCAEENALQGGAGSAVRDFLAAEDILVPTLTIGIKDDFIEPLESADLDQALGWDQASLQQVITQKLATLEAKGLLS